MDNVTKNLSVAAPPRPPRAASPEWGGRSVRRTTEFDSAAETLFRGNAVDPRDITVITPTTLDPDRVDWLLQLNETLTAAGVEHVVVVDGTRKPDPNLVGKVITLGKKVGAAAARNYGLAASTGRYVTSADDDDTVPVEGLLRRAQVLQDTAPLGWVAGYLADITTGGDRIGVWKNKARVGINLPGDVFDAWEGPDAEFPIAPTGLMIRRNVLLAEGGWGGLPQAEDFCMALRVTGRHPGELLNSVVYEYRKHPGQMMQSEGFDDLEPASRSFCYQMSAALKDSRLASAA